MQLTALFRQVVYPQKLRPANVVLQVELYNHVPSLQPPHSSNLRLHMVLIYKLYAIASPRTSRQIIIIPSVLGRVRPGTPGVHILIVGSHSTAEDSVSQ